MLRVCFNGPLHQSVDSCPDVEPGVLLGPKHARQGLVAVGPEREGLLLVGLEAAEALCAGERVHGEAVLRLLFCGGDDCVPIEWWVGDIIAAAAA